MAEILPLRRRRGRPRLPVVDLDVVQELSLPQVLAYARAKGRPMGRHRLMTAILTRQLPAFEDLARKDRHGNYLFRVRKTDLDAWLDSTLRPFHPAPMPGVSPSMGKGPLPRAL